MVLIFDTARFKYPPHWVSLKLFHEAICSEDQDSGMPRGFIICNKKFWGPKSKFCHTYVDKVAHIRAAGVLCTQLRDEVFKKSGK